LLGQATINLIVGKESGLLSFFDQRLDGFLLHLFIRNFGISHGTEPPWIWNPLIFGIIRCTRRLSPNRWEYGRRSSIRFPASNHSAHGPLAAAARSPASPAEFPWGFRTDAPAGPGASAI